MMFIFKFYLPTIECLVYTYIIRSLIVSGVHATRGLERVESGVLELPTQEVVREGLGPGEVFSGQVLLAWLSAPVVHV